MSSIAAINKEKLDQSQYLVSLVNAGAQRGLIDAYQVKSIPLELMEVLKEVMQMYTKGKSSTLKAETMEGLMKSIVYTLDLYLMNYHNPEDAINNLKSCNMRKIYNDAIEYAKHYIEDTKQLHKAIEAKRVLIPNVVYSETFSEAIPNFFLTYDVKYAAQDTTCDIDYPLAIDIGSVDGIAYIRRYLEAFELENEFCLKFQSQEIAKLLQSYGRLHGLNYRQSPINIFELVFHNAVFLTLLDKDYNKLLVSAVEFEIIEERLSTLNKSGLKRLIADIITMMIDNLDVSNSKLVDLIYKYAEAMIVRVNNALESRNLSNTLVLEVIEHTGDRTTLELGNKMSNKVFRYVYRRLMDCSNPEDKMVLLKKFVNSFDDFLDLLKADCFYENEYAHVFESLGNMELSTIICSEFKEYMLRGENKLSTLFATNISYNYDWERAFVDWLKKLNSDRIQAIELLVHKNLTL